MNKNNIYLTASLLVLSLLQACSEKTVNAPAAEPVVVVPATPTSAAAMAVAVKSEPGKKLKPILKAATMECGDRKVVLEASCLDVSGPQLLHCTKQSLVISETVSGKVLNTRNYAPVKGDGTVPDIIDEKVGEMTCVTTKTGAKYIVTNMFNGGNCPTCEWNEAYGWDGVFAGSDRDKAKKIPAVDDAVAAITEKDVDRVTGVNDMAGYYSEPEKK
ncbi:MAG: hypothetical protein WKG03_08990 [Telluria sp.]